VKDRFKDELLGVHGNTGILFRQLENGLQQAVDGWRMSGGKELAHDGFELRRARRGDLAQDELLLGKVVEEGGA